MCWVVGCDVDCFDEVEGFVFVCVELVWNNEVDVDDLEDVVDLEEWLLVDRVAEVGEAIVEVELVEE